MQGVWEWALESGSRLPRGSKDIVVEKRAADMGNTRGNSHEERKGNPDNKLWKYTLSIGIMGGIPGVGVSRRGHRAPESSQLRSLIGPAHQL